MHLSEDGPRSQEKTVLRRPFHQALLLYLPSQGTGTLAVVFKYETVETFKDKALLSNVPPPPRNVTPELAMMESHQVIGWVDSPFNLL